MPIDSIFSQTITRLEKALNLRSIQHKALASNIANMDTPNYKAVELDVAAKMNERKSSVPGIKLVRTHSDHFQFRSNRSDKVSLQAVSPPAYNLRGDGNTVDIDKTMGRMAENTLLYNAAAKLISHKLKGLSRVIRGGN